MYSVLIVDDEEPVLESYTYLIETSLEDFQVVGTARSGGEAIRVAREKRPDVVLMDIAMPGMDGLDTIAELQHEFHDALYILSTAYERFDLAQRAIPLGVFAYLVKPVSRKRFVETMIRAKTELDEERRRLDRRLEEVRRGEVALKHETQEFMLQLTWRPFDPGRWARYRELFRFTSDYGLVVALKLDDRTAYRTIAERVERRYRCLWSENLQRMIMFVADSASPEAIKNHLQKVVSEIVGPAEPVSISVGSRRRYDEINLSCDEALNAIPPSPEAEQQLRRFRARVREFGQAIARTRDAADVSSLYETLTSEVFAAWGFTVAKYRVAAAFERVLHDFDSRVGGPGASFHLADPVKEVVDFESRKELDAWAQRVLRRLVEEQSRHDGEHQPAVLKHAVQFIDTHFSEPLQLTTVAEHCQVSTGYLSRLFSEHRGVSFNDYLNSVRLDAAQRLLETDGGSIKEVAHAVGYHDPNYFSRIFRKFVGTSPTGFARGEGDDG